ncbi:MAG: helicase, partial [Chloroflexota bacterium]|nr:helicase [Chloroflexota bacterium]
MPTHDIIDNRNEKLVDHINTILGSTESARFAVGYFFVSGLESIASQLAGMKELRLLIGNTTNRQTLEQIAEGYRRLEMVAEAAEQQAYPKRAQIRTMTTDAAENIRSAVELMDQTDASETLLTTLVKMIQDKQLKVKIYTKGRLHAKAYIFDYRNDGRYEKGIAIVGSSNLTLSGVTSNTELNVVVAGNENHTELGRWFDALWDESQEFDEALMQEIQQSWAAAVVRPYDIYMKTLYALVKDRLGGEEEQDFLWDDEINSRLADFQRVAVKQAIQIIRDQNGAFVADVVGLGKSYVGAAIVKHFERIEHARPLILCPATLVQMWERYNEVYDLNARVLSTGFLHEQDDGSNILLKDIRFRDRDFVLIDESHNFRHSDTQRYSIVQDFVATGKHCCFLTATPRNSSAWDIYHQIKLFHQDDKTDLPVNPPNLKEYFKLVEEGERRLPELLSNILIRRTRRDILRYYGYDEETNQPLDPSHWREYLDGTKRAYIIVAGKHQFFPRRELETIDYSIEDTYQGLYQQLRKAIGMPHKKRGGHLPKGELTYARYGLWNYVHKEKQKREPYASLARAGRNLRGLMRIMMFKRFESSVFAFRETIRRMLKVHERFLTALKQGIVPAGEDAQDILYEPSAAEEQNLMEALKQVTGRYRAEDFDLDSLKKCVRQDTRILKKMFRLIEPISAEEDAKLQTLKKRLRQAPFKDGKCLIFTEYADTAQYLYDNLNPNDQRDDLDVIFSSGKDKSRVVGRFAPKANPEYQFAQGESELNMVIATDVMSEGLNLQDCDKIINYDLHWNPVRLIQRFGRIDRIGTEYDQVFGFNFLPELGIEKQLGLHETLKRRIKEIMETIGEDSAILDPTEQVNEEGIFAIYEKKGLQLSMFEEEEGGLLDLTEAEEIMRKLRAENPVEFERIANLRDGIRTGKASTQRGTFVFCQADRYQKLHLLDREGNVVSQDIPQILGTIRCNVEESAIELPKDHNATVTKTHRQFAEEVKQ